MDFLKNMIGGLMEKKDFFSGMINDVMSGEPVYYEKPPEEITKPSQGEPKEPVANFDTEQFRKGILHAENRGAVASGDDLYNVVGPTGDLGKYQVSPATLETWGPVFLEKGLSVDEFKASPDDQEEFFSQFTRIADRLKLSPQQAAVSWHRGWGELGTGDKGTKDQRFMDYLDRAMPEDKSVAYLEAFNEGIK